MKLGGASLIFNEIAPRLCLQHQFSGCRCFNYLIAGVVISMRRASVGGNVVFVEEVEQLTDINVRSLPSLLRIS